MRRRLLRTRARSDECGLGLTRSRRLASQPQLIYPAVAIGQHRIGQPLTYELVEGILEEIVMGVAKSTSEEDIVSLEVDGTSYDLDVVRGEAAAVGVFAGQNVHFSSLATPPT